MTIEVETSVTVEVGIRIPRQSQALEMAEDTADVSQVGIGGLVCGAGVDDRFAGAGSHYSLCSHGKHGKWQV